MNINRHNYEEWLLLYADKELSPADMLLVDQFLDENPDLQKELQLLQQSILTPDAIQFKEKDSLFKAECFTEEQQYQLLQLLDGELSRKEASALQADIAANTTLTKEWQLLQKTKLQADDSVVFIDKASLYRTERDRVIPIGWWRFAAAAVLIGFGVWGVIGYLKDSTIEANVVTADTRPAVLAPGKQQQAGNSTGNHEQLNQGTTALSEQDTPAAVAKSADAKQPSAIHNKALAPASSEDLIQKVNTVNTITTVASQTINSDAGNNTTPGNVPLAVTEPVVINKQSIADQGIDNSYAANVSTADNSTVRYASFDEEEEKPKKSRIGGFFKKVKRVIQRKTNINTGEDNNIKIANMSFAMQ